MDRAQVGKVIWVKLPDQLWVQAKVLSRKKDAKNNKPIVKVEIVGHFKDDVSNPARGQVIETDKFLPFDEEQMLDWNDVLRMHGELNEASLLQLLRRRFFANVIYTFAGDILVSINPYKDVGALTAMTMPSPEELESKEKEGNLVPHLHVVSERAHRIMLSKGPKGKSQSILINGESGSGKTEAAKCIMKCLAQRSYVKRQVLKAQASAGLNDSLKKMGVMGSSQLENRGMQLLASRGRGRGAALQQSSSRRLIAQAAQVSEQPEIDPNTVDVEDMGSKVERSFILANPLLEAFGNAKTVNNHNSSRFGKFVKIEYDDDGCIVGTQTKPFFLEKTRVVRRARGERNFHSFYQLLNANREHHSLLAEGFAELDAFASRLPRLLQLARGTMNADDEDQDENEDEDDDHFNEDVHSFQETCRAMEVMGLSESEQKLVWKMVSLILVIGELQFAQPPRNASDQKSNDNLERSHVSSGLPLVSSMLDVDPKLLETALCQKSVRAGNRGSISYTPLSVERAKDSCDGLIKALYKALFVWLVERVNHASREATSSAQKSRRKDPLFIGVLDIFGFEVLRTNSFEQLCINYTNEVMQRYFDLHVFDIEKHIYREEGVDSSSFTFRDNTPIINLINGKPLGLFNILDDQCRTGDHATDANFLQNIHKEHEKEPDLYRSPPPLYNKGTFEIRHFAGSVIYTVREFISKNTDSLQPDLAELLSSFIRTKADDSLAFFIGSVFQIFTERESSSGQPTTPSREESGTKRRIANLETGSFRAQLLDLSSILESTDQHFIRCVKPNRAKKPELWDAQLVLNQLNYLSVMEMVRIRTEGFPVRLLFSELVGRFPDLLTPTRFSWYPGSNDKRACETLMRSALGDSSEKVLWVLGSSKCFMREGVLESLMDVLRRRKDLAAAQIQKIVRGFLARRRYRKQRRACITIQRWYRIFEKNTEEKRNRAAVKMQCFARGVAARREKKKRMDAILTIQRFRRKLVKRREDELRRKIEKIQSWFRCRMRIKQYWTFRVNVIRFQARIRGAQVRRRYFKLMEAREPWKEFLRPNEAIVLTSLVQKTSDVHGVRSFTKTVGSLGGLLSSKKHRQLIFTTGPGMGELNPVSAPRLFYVDPLSRQWKGEIPYDSSITCGLTTGDKDFLIFSKVNDVKKDKDPIWTFTDVLGPSVCWIRSCRRNVSVLELVRDHQPSEFHAAYPTIEGPLLMRQLIGPKKYIPFHFSLVGTDMWWFNQVEQVAPNGGVNITASCTIEIKDNPRPLPGVPDFAFWLHTPMRAKPLKFRTDDPEVLKQWVKHLERAIQKCKDDIESKDNPVTLAKVIGQLGISLFESSDFLHAKLKFREALDVLDREKIPPNNRVVANQVRYDLLNYRARANFMLGLYERALDDASAGLSIKPGDESCLRTRAASYEQLRRFDESLRDYDDLVAFLPFSQELKDLRSKCMKTRDDMKAVGTVPKYPKPAIARQNTSEFHRQNSKALLGVPPPPKSPVQVMEERGRKVLNEDNSGSVKRKFESDQEKGAGNASIMAGTSSFRRKMMEKRESSSSSMNNTSGRDLNKSSADVLDEQSSSSFKKKPIVPPMQNNNEAEQSFKKKQTPIEASPPRQLAKFNKGDRVIHTRSRDGLQREGIILAVHADDLVNGYYYTLNLVKESQELQASEANLSHVNAMASVVKASMTMNTKTKVDDTSPPHDEDVVSSAPAVRKKSQEVMMDLAQVPVVFEEPIDIMEELTPVRMSDGAFDFQEPPEPKLKTGTKTTTSPVIAKKSATLKTSPVLETRKLSNPNVVNKDPGPVLAAAVSNNGKDPGPVLAAAVSSASVQQNDAEPKKKIKKRVTSGSGSGFSFAKAIANYTPSGEHVDDLQFKKGDEILVVHKYKDGWWKGTLNGKTGLFPSTFVQVIITPKQQQDGGEDL